MPGGTWGQQVQNTGQGGFGVSAPTPASPFDVSNQVINAGGDPSDFGRGTSSSQTRLFANVGKVNVNLVDPLAPQQAEQATNYQPVDGEGGLFGLGNYYNPMQPGGLFSGLFGAIGQTLGGVFGEGGAKTGSDIGTFLGKTVEMPMALVGSARGPVRRTGHRRHNSQIEKATPYILRDTLKIPTNVGGAFQSMLNMFGLAGTRHPAYVRGPESRAGALPADIQARVDSGELSHDDALDELVLSNRGFTNDGLHNLVWSMLTDPANWASLWRGPCRWCSEGYRCRCSCVRGSRPC